MPDAPELVAFREVVEQCRNVVEAHDRRSPESQNLTLRERQELAILFIRLDDYRDGDSP